MSKQISPHDDTFAFLKYMTAKSRNCPIICMLPHCFRIMLKQNYRKHCKSFHNFTLEDDLPESQVDTNLLKFL